MLAILFLVNDYIDDHVLDRKEKQYGLKLFLHVLITFIFTYIIVLLLWNLFGWGKTFFG